MRFLQGYEHVSTNNGASWGICISSGGYAGNASRPSRGERQAEQPWSLVAVRMRTQARLATTDSTSSPRTQVLAENAPAL